ncbi:3-oxo-tetronate kinase [Vibrio sp. CK2-1]|uniref:3-oxo-tetronate kinase n=1 Tax=Vibrio sp. CK2-1 TaxID=2912249 RepID=UPI001F3F91C9|nr:3-oxo-tetronate kinase [Vibrio sp. CK2-1]MCF7353166.1 four-carbon acid sugar kinase family protein [Vibrio sp. CK2-1]
MKIGVIADDFTGATDAASFIVAGGLNAIQVNGIPQKSSPQALSEYQEAQAIVVALKSRSCPVDQAIDESLAASDWLRQQGCEMIYFKYCSTFDSTKEGNIGPVTDALMQQLNCQQTLVCPALPVNGRSVYMGHLFVFEQLLSDSGMRHHPITPMTDSNLVSLMESQSSGSAGLLSRTYYESQQVMDEKLQSLQACQYIICDAIDDSDLALLGQLSLGYSLVTGGSGLVGAIAAAISQQNPQTEYSPYSPALGQRGIVISGSCSEMTNKQVAAYQQQAAAFKLNVGECINNSDYIDQVEAWVVDKFDTHANDSKWFPLVYATVQPDELKQIQAHYGARASVAVEALFSQLIQRLKSHDLKVIISAGGETSGTVVKALGATSFDIGRSIAPGVPWVRSLEDQSALALKSGNFGNEHFFFIAQEMMQ